MNFLKTLSNINKIGSLFLSISFRIELWGSKIIFLFINLFLLYLQTMIFKHNIGYN